MPGENTKNYGEQGGDRWVVGGELDIVGDGRILKDGEPLNIDIQAAAAQADSTAEDVAALRADFNALLAKLRTAGLMDTE